MNLIDVQKIRDHLDDAQDSVNKAKAHARRCGVKDTLALDKTILMIETGIFHMDDLLHNIKETFGDSK